MMDPQKDTRKHDRSNVQQGLEDDRLEILVGEEKLSWDKNDILTIDLVIEGKNTSTQYLIEGKLGSGGFGQTYKALDRHTHRRFVLKFPLESKWKTNPQECKNWFQGEAKALEPYQGIKHPNLVEFIELGHESVSQMPVIVMNYIVGSTLDSKGKTSEEQAIAFIKQIIGAVRLLHECGAVHRDISPKNVIIREDNNEAVLLDLGISRSQGGQRTCSGSPGFAPPEQLLGEPPQFYHDVYALAVLLKWLIQTNVSQQTDEAIAFVTKLDPQKRMVNKPSVDDFLKKLTTAPIPVPDSDPLPQPKPLEEKRSHFYLWPSLSLVAIVFAGAVFFLMDIPDPPPPPPHNIHMGIPVESYSYTSAGVSATGEKYTEKIPDLPNNAVKMEMVAISGGSFMMGSPKTEKGRSDDEQQQNITVPDFFMGRYEVTQAQYEAVMKTNPTTGKAWAWSESANTWILGIQIPTQFKGQDKPVVGVSWEDAQAFCEKLRALTGKPYHLPTEAEWEYAARAGTTTPFSYGESITPAVVNYNEPNGGEYRGVTMAVNTLLPNPWDLYHIHGNVWEWVEDEYSPVSDKLRVLRGGSWGNNSHSSRSAHRSALAQDFTSSTIGFRLVVDDRDESQGK